MNARMLALGGVLALTFGAAGCGGSTRGSVSAERAVPSYAEVALAEQSCMTKLQGSLQSLETSRMDVFFSAALNGLVDCEAASGLAHVPTKEITHWLESANGKAVAVRIPASPAALAHPPLTEAAHLPYQRACVGFMRRYLPASIARAGDDPDVAAAFIFSSLEQCDDDGGFATIEPHTLAGIMQKKHIL